jgi:hypothetical protein
MPNDPADKNQGVPAEEEAENTTKPQTEDNTQPVTDADVLDAILAKPEDELLPWEPVTLPSLGAYYGDSIPDGTVMVRPMGLHAEKILSTARLAKSGKAVDMVFEHCVRFPDESFDPLDLLVGDGTFILFYLRGITYGNMYEFTVKCSDSDCNHAMLQIFDLNELQDTIQNPKPGFESEPFEVTLPHMTEIAGRPFKVKVRMARRRDITSIAGSSRADKLAHPRRATTRKDRRFRDVVTKTDLDDTIEKNLNYLIVEAMGQKDRFKIQELVKRMSSADTSYIREFLEDVSPGVDTSIAIECPECGNDMNIQLPITESFFRRTVGGGDRESVAASDDASNGA